MLSTCGAGLKKTYFLLITTASYLKKKKPLCLKVSKSPFMPFCLITEVKDIEYKHSHIYHFPHRLSAY